MSRIQRPKIVNASSVEKQIRFQREIEDQKRHLEAYSVESAKLMSAANFQSNIDIRRQQAEQEAARLEKFKQDELIEKEKRTRIRENTSQQQSAILSEIEKETAEQERQRLEIQRICDESPELKELERMLKIAYLNKDRSVQQEEKLLLMTIEKERILAMEEDMERQRQNALKADEEKMQRQKSSYGAQRRLLQQQIDERKIQLLDARKQEEQDREMVDSIVRRINEEDEADYRRRKEMQEATAKMIHDFEIQRQRQREAAQAQERQEEEAILAYNKSLETRYDSVNAKRQAKKESEERILKQIIEETERKKQQEEEYNNMRDLLWEEELEQKRIQELEQRRQKQEENKKQMFDMNKRLIQMKQQMRFKEAENEMKLIEAMKAKFADDERREQMEEQAALAARLRHRDVLNRQMSEKQIVNEQQKIDELRQLEEAKRKEEYRKRVIEEARKRLLEQHATQLKGYLPSKVQAQL